MLILVMAAGLPACKKGEPSGSGNSGSGDSRFPSSSQLGRTRDMGKEVGGQIGNNQAQAENLANETMGGTGVKINAVQFNPPKSWKKGTPSGAESAAEYRVSGSAGEAVVTFSTYTEGTGGRGDPVLAVDHWESQIKSNGQNAPSKVTTATTAGMPVTRVASEGTYMSGPPGGTKKAIEGQRSVGVIIESPRGSIFVRLIGPTRTVAAAEREFDAMIESMKSGQ